MRAIKNRLPKSSREIQKRAKELRKNSTDAERLLWSRLRANRLNDIFRRQEPIGHYIVDFVCIDKGVIIELDGSQHYEAEGKAKDQQRDEYLESLGFKVLRFSNLDVFGNIEGVLTEILKYLRKTPP